MPDLPTGTVTFLFTDIEGSTRLWQDHPADARVALVRHDALVEQIVAEHEGQVVRPRGEGDSRFAVFARATNAVAAAAALQQALHAEPWPTPARLRVRIAIHTGEADLREDDYYGNAVNRCARLRVVAYGGQTLLSQATYDLVRDAIIRGVELRDLGEHRLKDLIRPERIFQLVLPDLPTDFPPLKTLDAHPNNLPVQRDPLIGRERELTAVAALLRRVDVCLVTLTGAGGSGKTRLSLQVAAELLDDFPDGVWLVDLAPITDPALVASTIATTFGVKEVSGEPLVGTLQASLREKQLLLLLDNFEQVVAAAPLVVNLLKAAPRIKALVTSRIVLHVSQEQEYPVPPLTLPEPVRRGQPPPSLERLTKYAAVELFIQRTQRVKPDFQITNQSAPAVAAICVRLDGLPLAIELAAARTKLFAPQALLQRLEHPLGMLTGGGRDLHARHQTLRQTIDWSYQLLDAEEQRLFQRLGVFVGGCTIEAAEGVCYATGDLQGNMLDALASLVDKSLLRLAEGVAGEPRFTMLETIREYALERLADSEALAAYRQRHAAYYVALAEQAVVLVEGPERRAWMDRLEADHDNLRAAIRWALESGEVETGLRLTGALHHLWGIRGYCTEGRAWITELLAEPAAACPTRGRALALNTAGMLAWHQSDFSAAQAYHAESLSVFRALGDTGGVARQLNALGTVAYAHGDLRQAQAHFDASLTQWRAVNDHWQIALVLNNLGAVALAQGDVRDTSVRLEESLAISRKLGHKRLMGLVLANLGELAYLDGDYTAAYNRQEQALALFTEEGDTFGIAWARMQIGFTLLHQGDGTRAARFLAESLQQMYEMGNKWDIALGLEGFACLARAEARSGEGSQRAARLFAAAEAVRAASAAPIPATYRRDVYENIAAVRKELDAATAAACWAEGQAMPLEQAVVYALQEAPAT